MILLLFVMSCFFFLQMQVQSIFDNLDHFLNQTGAVVNDVRVTKKRINCVISKYVSLLYRKLRPTLIAFLAM